ncbi:hypothetical protein RJ639_012660, partial [Escallonia herrerae]
GECIESYRTDKQLAPKLLDKNKDLHFNLLSLHLLSLSALGSGEDRQKALEFAQNKLIPFGKVLKGKFIAVTGLYGPASLRGARKVSNVSLTAK